MALHTQPYPLSEIIQQSPGFHGVFTEAGSEGSQSIQAHMVRVACPPQARPAHLSCRARR
jgi:hypothetical protein